MSAHQHTVLALLIAIIVLRLVGSGRLGAGWAALWRGGTAAAAPTGGVSGGTGATPSIYPPGWIGPIPPGATRAAPGGSGGTAPPTAF